MKGKNTIIAVLTVTAGVFVAGYLMNALRDNDLVKKSINGFDA